jgi:hypothetical protein
MIANTRKNKALQYNTYVRQECGETAGKLRIHQLPKLTRYEPGRTYLSPVVSGDEQLMRQKGKSGTEEPGKQTISFTFKTRYTFLLVTYTRINHLFK